MKKKTKKEEKLSQRKSTIIFFFVTIIFSLGILLGFLMSSIAFGEDISDTEAQQLYDNGTLYGMQITLLEIIKQGSECNPVSIPYEGKNYDFILVECLTNGS